MEKGEIVSGNLYQKFSNWNLDKKINVFVTCLIYTIIIIMLTIFTVFYCSSFINQSNSITRNQLSALAVNYENRFMNYYGLAVGLSIDESIQKYLEKGDPNDEDYYRLVDNVRNALQNAVNMNNGVQYIALVSYRLDSVLYRGNLTKISNTFHQVYKQDYGNSVYCYGKSTIRLSYNDSYLGRSNKMLNLYVPVYSTSKIGKEIGLLCVIDDKSMFAELSGSNKMEFDSEVFIIDENSNSSRLYIHNSNILWAFHM